MGAPRNGRPRPRLAAPPLGLLVLSTFFVFLLAATAAAGQSQTDLERRRRALAKQITATSKLLETAGRDRAAALDRLTGLQRQIVQREELIGLLERQIAFADSSASRTEGVLLSLERDLATLSEEYGRMARAALRHKLLDARLGFVLSAESLSDAFRRTLYLRRYDANRRRQLELIAATRAALASKADRVTAIRAEKEALLTDERTQQRLLEDELAAKNELIASLRGDEARLRVDLARQQADRRQLDRAIADVIAEAARAAERRREREAAAARSSADAAVRSGERVPSDNYATALAADFAKNRGRLPWPVAEGFVSKPFGQRAHPTLPRVQVNNNGVDIRTAQGAEVRAVFEGEVVGLQSVPGYHTMVILQHGDYYTVYSNLIDVRVKRGARVGTADVLGAVAVDAVTGTSELHFEVWQGRATQNPTRWVRGLR